MAQALQVMHLGCADGAARAATTDVRSTDAPPVLLTRALAAAQLGVDTLWRSEDQWATYAYQRAGMTCEDWTRANDAHAMHRLVNAEALVEYADSSRIGVDSVWHWCAERPTALAHTLEVTPSVRTLPNVYFITSDARGVESADDRGRYSVRLRTHRARFDAVTGIIQAPNATDAQVDFTVRQEATAYGNAVGPEVGPVRRRSARFRRYDDGWRLTHID